MGQLNDIHVQQAITEAIAIQARQNDTSTQPFQSSVPARYLWSDDRIRVDRVIEDARSARNRVLKHFLGSVLSFVRR